MTSYRTSMQIVADLLDATQQSGQEGIKTTALLTKANLSHSRLSKFLGNLTGAGLINKIEFDGKNTFVITFCNYIQRQTILGLLHEFFKHCRFIRIRTLKSIF